MASDEDSILWDGSVETAIFLVSQFDNIITWLNERATQNIRFKMSGSYIKNERSYMVSATGTVLKNWKGKQYSNAIYLFFNQAKTEDPAIQLPTPNIIKIDKNASNLQDLLIENTFIPEIILLENDFTKDLRTEYIFRRNEFKRGFELTNQYIKSFFIEIIAIGSISLVTGKKVRCMIHGTIRHLQEEDIFVEIINAIDLNNPDDDSIREYLKISWFFRLSRKRLKTNHMIPDHFYLKITPSERLKTDLVIDINNLSVSYEDNQVLKDVSFSMKSGEILGIIGESGAGKTTCLRAILGEIEYDGEIKVFNINAKKTKEIAPLYGYVPQDLALQYQTFNALENILAFASQFNLPQEIVLTRGKEILEELNITSSKPVNALSGGQKRRVSIAIAMAHAPKSLFLDEPTSGLDPKTRFELWKYLDIINKTYKTSIVVISHYLDEIEFCDKAAIFLNGIGFYDFGSPEDLKRSIPGKGLAFEVTLESVSMDAVDILRELDGVNFLIQRGERLRLLSDLPSATLAERVIDVLNENKIKIHSLEWKVQVDMIDYFSYISWKRDQLLGYKKGSLGAVE